MAGSIASVVIDAGTWEDIGDIGTYARIASAVPPLRYGDGPLAGEEVLITPALVNANTVIPAKAGIQEREGDRGEEAAFIHEILGLAAEAEVTLTPVGKGGSDRAYFRVAAAGWPPAVLMRYGRMYEENDRLHVRCRLS